MNSQELQKYWQDNDETLYVYSPSQVDKTKVDYETFLFLTTCGLPSEAAPFLSFDEIRKGRLLTPNQIFKTGFKNLNNYFVFGSNASGDPVCIDATEHNQIVYLHHDNDCQQVFINSSILQFAICLTKYRDFIISLADTTTGNFVRRKFTNTEFEKLGSDFKNTDSDCLSNDCFWKAELIELLCEQNDK